MRDLRILDTVAGEVALRPTQNRIYLMYLVKANEPSFNQEDFEKALSLISDYFEVWHNGRRKGVIYATLIDGKYYLDAYKDPNEKAPIKVSKLAYYLFSIYISEKANIIYTVNKGVEPLFSFLTREVGFTHISTLATGFFLYERRLHGQRHMESVINGADSLLDIRAASGRKSEPDDSEQSEERSGGKRERDPRSDSQSGRRSKSRSKKEKKCADTDHPNDTTRCEHTSDN